MCKKGSGLLSLFSSSVEMSEKGAGTRKDRGGEREKNLLPQREERESLSLFCLVLSLFLQRTWTMDPWLAEGCMCYKVKCLCVYLSLSVSLSFFCTTRSDTKGLSV